MCRVWKYSPNVRSLFCGTNADKRFAIACPREELPSFAIGLLKNIVTTATGVETVKIKGFSVGFIVVRFFR